MKPSSEDKYQVRARIGVGASAGAVIGALLTILVNPTSSIVALGSLLGAVFGGIIGSFLRSQSFQFIWIEYSSKVALRLIVTVVPLTALILAYFYTSVSSTSLAIQIALLAGTLITMVLVGYALKSAISELDDVLLNIQKEAAVIGFITAVCIFFTLGMVNQIYPIPSHWLFSFIVILFSFLIGRFVVGWRHR